MSRSSKVFTPASLLKCFDPPEEFIGEVGWLCGYSADAGFLDAAAQRFTLETAAQRAYMGRVALLAMLDPGQPQIRPHEAPGVLHVPMRNLATKPFALLHAKVALMLFRHPAQPQQWRLRLVVSTGNWTRQTLEESLDLVWAVELGSDEAEGPDASCRQARADIRNAWDLLEWLAGLFDTSAITDSPNGRSAALHERMRRVCGALGAPARVRSRFFHSRRTGLLSQLPSLVRQHAGSTRRNCIFMGSGFFEGSVAEGQVPTVLADILQALRTPGDDGPLLTASADVYVVAERTGCQAVAASLLAMQSLGWKVGPPRQPACLGMAPRSLHAKFILSANDLPANDNCVSAWVYLGSGNLTRPGFINRMSAAGGNLEAGVVFADDSLAWYGQPKSPKGWVQNRLPIQYDEEFGVGSVALPAEGSGMPERPPEFEVAPVAWCRYEAQPDPARLVLPGDGVGDLTILNPEGQPCNAITATEVAWPDAAPRSVQVRWRMQGQWKSAFIPVVDAAGRVAGASLPALDMDAAWWQLERFPLAPPPEEDADQAAEHAAGQSSATRTAASGLRESETAVRVMMRLVENVANKQTALSQADWPAWCASLHQTLLQAKDSAAVKAFVQWGLNPLSALREAPFRPWFAEGPADAKSAPYEQALALVEAAWGVAACKPAEGSELA